MNNTLTAKEWLINKLGNPGGKYTEEQEINIWMMEQYANYKNRILEDRIKEFKKVFKNKWNYLVEDYSERDVIPDILEQYNKHFNIENKQ